MQRPRLLAEVLAVLLVAVPSVSVAQPRHTVVLLGDSITLGVVSEPVGPPYADLVAEWLGEDYGVVRIGCGGAQTNDWLPSTSHLAFCAGEVPLPNFYYSLAFPLLPADVVTILLGTNDALGFDLTWPVPVPVEEFVANMDELIGALLADGAQHVILLTAPRFFGGDEATQARLADYANAIPVFCDDISVHCGPDLHALLDLEDFAENDIHPNASGHAKIAEELVDRIVMVVPEPSANALALTTLLGVAVLGRRSPRCDV